MKIQLLLGDHLACAPRPQKEALALKKAGHEVQLLTYCYSESLASEDREIANQIGVQLTPVTDIRVKNWRSFAHRFKNRIAKECFRRFGHSSPRAFGPTAPELLTAARHHRANLLIVHCEAGLWAGQILKKEGLRVGVDFEDWFSQDLLPEARVTRPVNALRDLERWHLLHADFCLAPTDEMAREMARDAHADRIPLTIPNCFPFDDRIAAQLGDRDARGAEVSLYWYSQTIGPGRGLEILGQALSQVTGNWKLRLRGTLGVPQAWFDATFPAPIRDRVEILAPVSNADLLARHMSHDVGLALEIPFCRSRDTTATNKIFDYLRAGLAVVATDTSGQREVMKKCPHAGWLVPAGDLFSLRSALQNAVDRPEELNSFKQAAQNAAEHDWNWNSYSESLVRLVNECFSK